MSCVFYTDPFIHPPIEIDSIRLASIEEIIAMKMDVIQRGGKKRLLGFARITIKLQYPPNDCIT
jgi:hypothetical protein